MALDTFEKMAAWILALIGVAILFAFSLLCWGFVETIQWVTSK